MGGEAGFGRLPVGRPPAVDTHRLDLIEKLPRLTGKLSQLTEKLSQLIEKLSQLIEKLSQLIKRRSQCSIWLGLHLDQLIRNRLITKAPIALTATTAALTRTPLITRHDRVLRLHAA